MGGFGIKKGNAHYVYEQIMFNDKTPYEKLILSKQCLQLPRREINKGRTW